MVYIFIILELMKYLSTLFSEVALIIVYNRLNSSLERPGSNGFKTGFIFTVGPILSRSRPLLVIF